MDYHFQKFLGQAGYSGAGIFTSLTLVDVEIIVRILVGLFTIASLIGHWVLKLRRERERGKGDESK